MVYTYKGYDEKNDIWIYGECEIIVNQEDLSKTYFIVNKNGKYEFTKDKICKITPLTASLDNKPIYDKDIITIDFQDNPTTPFVVCYGEGKLYLENEDVTIYGLFLKGYDDKNYIFSDSIVNNSNMINIVGNILEINNN